MEALKDLELRIVSCSLCPRLVEFREKVAEGRPKRYRDWVYWAKPLPGFGDPEAKLLIVGLAPAAHGGNRTGRMFTGDGSGRWLAKILYETKFANQPTSTHREDGFRLKDAYITAVVRCAPPQNRPTSQEIKNCNQYLVEEIKVLSNLKIILCLGSVALKGTLMALRKIFPDANLRGLKFGHFRIYRPEGIPYTLITSYHPSRQNTQTGRLRWEDWERVFRYVREVLG